MWQLTKSFAYILCRAYILLTDEALKAKHVTRTVYIHYTLDSFLNAHMLMKQSACSRHRRGCWSSEVSRRVTSKTECRHILSQKSMPTLYKIEEQQEPTAQHRELYSVTYSGKESEKDSIHTHVTESLCHTPETLSINSNKK